MVKATPVTTTLYDPALSGDLPIYFYSTRERPYGCFSNFSRHGFALDDAWWPTSEHYYQAQKFAGTPYVEVVRQLSRPSDAARLGRDRRLPLRQDWENVKDQVMRQALLRKFASNPEICSILLSTGGRLIVEKTTSDGYWGCGADGRGRNRLGYLLMEVRTILRQGGGEANR